MEECVEGRGQIRTKESDTYFFLIHNKNYFTYTFKILMENKSMIGRLLSEYMTLTDSTSSEDCAKLPSSY